MDPNAATSVQTPAAAHRRAGSDRIANAKRSDRPLLVQLGWFVSLRWIAAATVIVGALVDLRWLGLYPHDGMLLAAGLATAAYNLVLWLLVRRARVRPSPRNTLLFLAWTQILLDLTCLTLLTLWTGGSQSPLLGFFVFHMVFASILLPRPMAYGGAAMTVVAVGTGLASTDQWPHGRQPWLSLAAWVITLLFTVHLANRITGSLRRQRRRLVRKNRHIRQMARRLSQQQRAMVQHEKMVALGQMAAGVTHEIANPLASMDSLLQLLERRPERLRPEAVATLRQQVTRIHQIIQQMSGFAHPAETQWQNVPLNEVVEQSLAIVRFDARMKNIRLDLALAPNVGRWRMLPHAIQQVLVNLMRNALDAMADTLEPCLSVRTLRQQDGTVSIDVTDNGSGIRPEHMNRLFEPFFTTKPVGKGTGLGLSISYRLIEQQGGRITARSKPGQGATFRVTLPASAAFPPQAKAARSAAS